MAVKLVKGTHGLVVWESNPKSSRFSVKSSRFDGLKTTKIVLPETGFEPKPGERWMCQVVLETNPESTTKGAFIVSGISKREGLTLTKDFWIDPDVSQEIAQDLACPETNIMLVGPQGCGKTVLANAISDALGHRFHYVDCTLVRSKIDWFGVRGLDVKEGATVTTWTDADFAKALRQAHDEGDRIHVIFFDELNRCPMDARNAVLRIIYGEDKVARLPNGDVIPVGDNIIFIAAVNEGRGFGGIAGMDAAFADRWSRHKMGYPPPDEEKRILKKEHPEAADNDLAAVVSVAKRLREQHDQGNLPKTISMRATLNAARRLAMGSSLKRALISAVVNQFEGDYNDPASDAGQAWNYIKGVIPAGRLL